MRHWFKDQQFRALLKNSSYLGVSKGVAALCGIATLAFAGRGLGVILFGTLILITSYAKAVSGIAKFQSWQLIVRYGGHGIAHGDPEHFRVATGFAFALDVVSGLVGLIAGAALLPFVGQWAGIKPEYLYLAMLYCTLVPIMTSATPDGVLRVLDRFDLISWSGTLMPITRAVLAGAAFMTGASFPVYVIIWYVHRARRAGVPMVPRLARAEAASACSRESARRSNRPFCPAPGASRSRSILRPACRRCGGRSDGWSSAACSARRERPCSASPRRSPTARRSPPTCSARPSIRK